MNQTIRYIKLLIDIKIIRENLANKMITENQAIALLKIAENKFKDIK